MCSVTLNAALIQVSYRRLKSGRSRQQSPNVAIIKVWKVRTAFRLIKFVLYRASCLPAHKEQRTFPILRSRSAGQETRQDKLQLKTELVFFFFYFNIIMANKKRSIETQICDPCCVDFISNRRDLQRFYLLGSAAMQMNGDPYVAQKGYLSALHF